MERRISLTKKKKLILIALVLTAIIIVAEVTGLRAQFDIQYIRTFFEHHWVLSSLIFITIFTFANLIQIPGWPFLVAAILSLGKVNGALLTYVAAVISCSVSFFIIERIAKGALHSVNISWLQKTLDKLETHPIRSVFILRALLQTAPPLNYTLALSSVSFKNYFIGTVLGLPFPILTYCIFFDFLFQRFL